MSNDWLNVGNVDHWSCSCLEPSLTTQSQCKARLELQARGSLVPPINGVPILLSADEIKDEEDNEFIRWVNRTRASAVCTL